MPEAPPWSLALFIERLDRWITQEEPQDDLRLLVTAWVFTRSQDPYAAARREPGFDNLWFAIVPGSASAGHVVACAYFVEERARRVRCDSFATLSWPV